CDRPRGRAAEECDEVAPVQLIELHHKHQPEARAAAISELSQIERSNPTASCHFGALRSDAGWPGNLTFLPVSVTWVPSILRIDMSLARNFRIWAYAPPGKKATPPARPPSSISPTFATFLPSILSPTAIPVLRQNHAFLSEFPATRMASAKLPFGLMAKP